MDVIINKNSFGALVFFFFFFLPSLVKLAQTEPGRTGWPCEGRHSPVLTSSAISRRGLELAGAMPRDAWCLKNVNSFQIRNQRLELTIT